MKLYVLQQDVTTATKKARAMCFDADVINPLTFTEEAEREISVKNICGSLKESFVNDKIIEMSKNGTGDQKRITTINNVKLYKY